MALEPLPHDAAISFFEKKGYVTSYHWADMWQGEHVRAFTVAKVMRGDLLADIREAVDAALRDGVTFREFARDLMPTLDKYGWTGFKQMTDPITGEIKRVELGTPRRLRIIYETNLRMANAAGRWEKIERNKRFMPYLVYYTADDDRVRDEHRPWHMVILPVDHPFWNTHYPPNGWRCRCRVRALTKGQASRLAAEHGITIGDVPEINWVTRPHPRTGEMIRVPEGIHSGFAYNVGKAHMRGLSPLPKAGPIVTPRRVGLPKTIDPANVPMPPPRLAPAERMLPKNISSDDAIDAFLGEFGATRAGRGNGPVMVTDPLGQPLLISEDFFRYGDGTVKMVGGVRKSAALLLADTLRDPDEIWWHWERVWLDREQTRWRYRLTRRYFARWLVEGQSKPVDTLVAAEFGKDGWQGVTAFRPKGQNYLTNQRGSILGYRREEP